MDMSKKQYQMDCAGIPVNITFLNSETVRYFKGYLNDCMKPAEISIAVTPEYMNENRWLVSEDEKSESYLEFQALMLKLGNTLLTHHRALFHAAALLWNDRAWLITAPSGTGKTTQLKHWHRLLKDDVKVINGDKPMLECREDSTVWVHSSPWRGKEKYGHPDLHAPLGGVIILQQAKHNALNLLDSEEAVIPLYRAFVSVPENTDQIGGQAEILESILKSTHVWKLENLGDQDSAKLTLGKLYLGEEL